jgi:hypothetical protein
MDSGPPDPGVVVQFAEMGVVPPLLLLPGPLPDEELPEPDELPDPPLDEELPEPDVLPDPLLDEELPELDVLPDPPLDEELPELDVLPDPPLDEELPEPDVLPDPPLDEEFPAVVEPEVPDAEGVPLLSLPPHPARQIAALNSDTRTLDCCTFLRGTVLTPRPSGRLSPAKIVPDNFVMVISLAIKPGHNGPGWIGGIDRHRSPKHAASGPVSIIQGPVKAVV